MAKLKIIVPNTNDEPDVDGYVLVVNNLVGQIEKYLEFLDADPDERPALLQAAATGNHVVKQLAPDGTFEAISNTNCKIVAQRDARRRTGNKPSRVTMPIPDVPPANFNYLAGYAQKIVALYAAGEQDKAHKFMFGIMMLTRCR
jgi:hypothetical protein